MAQELSVRLTADPSQLLGSFAEVADAFRETEGKVRAWGQATTDAGRQAQTAMQQAVAAFAGVDEPFRDARDSADAFKDALDAGDAVSRLTAALDPAYAATQRYEQAQAQVARAVSLGAMTQEEANRVLALAKAQYEAAGQAALASGQRMAQGVRVGAHQVQNLAYQFNDIGMMLAAGQSPLMLAMQQGTQVAQVLGPMGAAGAARALAQGFMAFLNPMTLVTVGSIAAGAAMIQWLTGAGEEAESLEDRLSGVKDAVDAYRDAVAAAGRSDLDLMNSFGGDLTAARELLAIQREITRYRAEVQMAGSARAIADHVDLGRYLPSEVPTLAARIRQLEAERDEIARQMAETSVGGVGPLAAQSDRIQGEIEALGPIADALRQLEGTLDLKADEAERLADALASLDDAQGRGIDAYIGRLRQALQIISDSVEPGEQMTWAAQSLAQNLADALAAALALRHAQEADLGTAREQLRTSHDRAEVMRLIATYGEDSAEVAAERAAQERRAHVEMIRSLNIAEDLKEELIAAYDAERRMADAEGYRAFLRLLDTALERVGGTAEALERKVRNARIEVEGLDGTPLSGLEAAFKGVLGIAEQFLGRIAEIRGDLAPEAWDALDRHFDRNQATPTTQDRIRAARDQSAAADQGILSLIRYVEGTHHGTRGYNETLGRGMLTGGDVNLVNMTLREVLELQRQMLRHPDNRWNSSAVGAYQIVGTTLGGARLDGSGGLIQQLGLSLDERFSPQLQDQLANALIQRRMPQGLQGFRNEWEGFKAHNTPWATIQRALSVETVPDPVGEVDQRAAEEAARRAQTATDHHAQLQRILEDERLLLSLSDAQLEDREAALAVRRAERAAAAAGTELTAQERAEIEAITRARLAEQGAQERRNELLKEARDLQAEITLLQDRQGFLEGQVTHFERIGDQAGAAAAKAELESVNAALATAIDGALTFWETIGGPESAAAIQSLRQERVELGQTVSEMDEIILGMRADLSGGISSGFETFFVDLITGAKSAGDAFQALGDTIIATFARILAERFTERFITPLADALAGAIFPAGGNFLTGRPTGGAPARPTGAVGAALTSIIGPYAKGGVFAADDPQPFAKGGVLEAFGEVVEFAKGGTPAPPAPFREVVDALAPPPLSAHSGQVVDRPTLFGLADGRTGLMGEAGSEAIMPLTHGAAKGVGAVTPDGGETTLPLARLASGKLGVVLPEIEAFAKGGVPGGRFEAAVPLPELRPAILDGPAAMGLQPVRPERAEKGGQGDTALAAALGALAKSVGRSAPKVTVINNAGRDVEVTAAPSSQGGDAMEIVVNRVKGALMQDARDGGDLSRALAGVFGLARQGR